MKLEVIDLLRVSAGGVFLDATFGDGGHTAAILQCGGTVIGLDRDLETLQAYLAAGEFRADARLSLRHGRMSLLSEAIPPTLFDGALADLGVSTRQILSSERGFSFQRPGPLDMRMDATQGKTLADILEVISERDLADALYQMADIKASRRIAAELVTGFRKGTIRTTADLLRLVSYSPQHRHPATQLFMGLRMLVNRELEEIELGIPEIFERLRDGGRLCVISFHSVEDRLVKRIFKRLAGQCICELQPCGCPRLKRAALVTKKPLVPTDEEIYYNPRARSAKLRCIEKISS